MQIQPANAVNLAQQIINKQQTQASTDDRNQAREIIERAQQARSDSSDPQLAAQTDLKSRINPNPNQLAPELQTRSTLSTTTARFEQRYQQQVEAERPTRGGNISIRV